MVMVGIVTGKKILCYSTRKCRKCSKRSKST